MVIKIKKIPVLFFALVVPLLFFKTSYAEEIEEEPVLLQIIIHKLIAEKNTSFINNGERETDGTTLEHLIGLNDVAFAIYDITDQLEERVEKGDTLEQAQLNLTQASYPISALVPLQTGVTANSNNENGIVSFDLPIFLSKRQAFLVYESSSPEEVTVKSDQLVLITPVYSQLGERMDTVHLYPKNILKSTAPTQKVDTTNKKDPVIIENGEKNKATNFNQLPSTGEIIQSVPFLLGMILVSVGAISYHQFKKKAGELSDSSDSI